MAEPLSAARRAEIQSLDLLAVMDPADAAVVSRALADLLGEIDRLIAELDPLWPCVCGHPRSQHRYDAAIGRNFCRNCPTTTDLHDYVPADPCACPDGGGVHQVGCPQFTPGTEA